MKKPLTVDQSVKVVRINMSAVIRGESVRQCRRCLTSVVRVLQYSSTLWTAVTPRHQPQHLDNIYGAYAPSAPTPYSHIVAAALVDMTWSSVAGVRGVRRRWRATVSSLHDVGPRGSRSGRQSFQTDLDLHWGTATWTCQPCHRHLPRLSQRAPRLPVWRYQTRTHQDQSVERVPRRLCCLAGTKRSSCLAWRTRHHGRRAANSWHWRPRHRGQAAAKSKPCLAWRTQFVAWNNRWHSTVMPCQKNNLWLAVGLVVRRYVSRFSGRRRSAGNPQTTASVSVRGRRPMTDKHIDALMIHSVADRFLDDTWTMPISAIILSSVILFDGWVGCYIWYTRGGGGASSGSDQISPSSLYEKSLTASEPALSLFLVRLMQLALI